MSQNQMRKTISSLHEQFSVKKCSNHLKLYTSYNFLILLLMCLSSCLIKYFLNLQS